jgi:hypothetical protein
MLKTKVIKLNLGVICGIIHAKTNIEEETRQWLKRR